jgi:hypothetical protein
MLAGSAIPWYLRLVSVGNVFCSGSSSQRQDSKRAAEHAPKEYLPSARPKLSATNSIRNCIYLLSQFLGLRYRNHSKEMEKGSVTPVVFVA